VPSPPDLGRSEHPTTSAHVPERSLPCAVRTTSWNSGNTRHSSPRTPWLRGSLMASFRAHSIRLPLVLGQRCVHRLHHIRSNRRQKHRRQNRGLRITLPSLHCDKWPRCSRHVSYSRRHTKTLPESASNGKIDKVTKLVDCACRSRKQQSGTNKRQGLGQGLGFNRAIVAAGKLGFRLVSDGWRFDTRLLKAPIRLRHCDGLRYRWCNSFSFLVKNSITLEVFLIFFY
jgi:hypothetical protein